VTGQHPSHPTVDERRAHGAAARLAVPLDSHAGWEPSATRPDPVELLDEQNRTRDQDLVPVRHARMAASPFTFYRGAARLMAEDLWRSPTAGLTVQLCGDAHLSNFGIFGSPERTLVFDINDFDETLPGPFEYDVKRLAASFTIAARNNGFAKADVTAVTRASVRAYREAMGRFSQLPTLDIWYAHLPEKRLLQGMSDAIAERPAAEQKSLRRQEKRVRAITRKARARDSRQALSKLGELVDGRYRIASDPPYVVPLRDWVELYPEGAGELPDVIRRQLAAYRTTLRPDLQLLFDRFELVDIARKVVGVGSVGTRAYIVLLQGRDDQDPLFLQLKEATSSVLGHHLPRSPYDQHGERVVQGQRLMQAASDIFLGWTTGEDPSRGFYWRQLRDMKGSVEVESMGPAGLTFYAQTCGWTLARAHARSGDPVAIAAYLGGDDSFDRGVADFARRYARQNERDYAAFTAAIADGRLAAAPHSTTTAPAGRPS
jgi:uncharacterized protein (DUF2252 family)